MILNNAPQHEAILSNVGEIGEFRIRNSAKAFNILSSGLYANKIRAIIRELSCNAVDSHVAAGKVDTPFDVHLPNQLEPYFSIRDYGTGLNHEQVTNIYTTYFESTKTDSNAFIGALGLGSKSPFSYTDNFTVTAVKDGVKGIYSAFINEVGVPSIALMGTEATDEPAGVEIKFAVNDRYDFGKFRDEAATVYMYFNLRPVISGSAEFKFKEIEYVTRDIIPGVHQKNSGMYSSRSTAVMGNIGYPVEIPQADTALGNLANLLGCGLEMHFAIGELDFQASREGLSYIPQTIDAIKKKLESVNAVLATKLAEEADAIGNLWDRAIFLSSRKSNGLWSAAVEKYVADNPIPTFTLKRYSNLAEFKLKTSDLASNYNIDLRVFRKNSGTLAVKNVKVSTEWSDVINAMTGQRETWTYWDILVDSSSHFVINDTVKGAGERVKYHYRKANESRTVYLLEPVDREKVMDTKGFFDAIHNPPVDRVFVVSDLSEKPRASSMGRDVTIMRLERRQSGGYHREREMVWRDAGKADQFDKTKTYYYVPLSGFQLESSVGYTSGKDLYEDIKSLPSLFAGEVYGVRKKDIEEIKGLTNWVNLEEHIKTKLTTMNNSKLLLSVVKGEVDDQGLFKFMTDEFTCHVDSDDSLFIKTAVEFKNVDKFSGSTYNLTRLFSSFAPKNSINPKDSIAHYNEVFRELDRRYPLLKSVSTYRIDASDIAEYINLIDSKKGV